MLRFFVVQYFKSCLLVKIQSLVAKGRFVGFTLLVDVVPGPVGAEVLKQLTEINCIYEGLGDAKALKIERL